MTGVPLTRRHLLGLSLSTGAAALAGCAVPTTGGGGGGGGGSGTVNALFMKQASYSEEDIRGMIAAFTKAHPGIKVEPTFVAFEALHDKIVISAPAGTYDVVHIDCTWPAELASKNMLLDVTDRYDDAWSDDILRGTLGTVTYENRRYGLPWSPGGKMFYYNARMLREAGIPPKAMKTWDGVLDAARTLRKKKISEHPLVWSWSHAEALVCDYAQLLGAFGGRFLDADGKAAFHKGGGVKALEWMKQTIDDGLTDPASVKLLEDDVKKVVVQGSSAFALNWDYMWAESNDPKASKVVGQLRVTTTPAGPGGRAPAVNGSMGLAVTRTSKEQDAAWQLVRFLAGKKTQLRYATHSLPIWKSAFDDPKLTTGGIAPLASAEQRQLDSMIDRPVVVDYNAVSQQIQAAVQSVLVDGKEPAGALAEAAARTDEIMEG